MRRSEETGAPHYLMWEKKKSLKLDTAHRHRREARVFSFSVSNIRRHFRGNEL